MADQETEDIFRELLQQESEQEITRATTVQGQILGLVVLLRDLNILKREHVDQWGELAEKVSKILYRIALMKAPKSEDEDKKDALRRTLNGTLALTELFSLLGGEEQGMKEALAYAEVLKEQLDVLCRD